MKILFVWMTILSFLYAGDATIEVIKKVDSLPSLAIEDSSIGYDDTFKIKLYKTLIADMNVLSIFNVDRHKRETYFDDQSVISENKNMDYVLRYKAQESDNGFLNIDIKLFKHSEVVLTSKYKISKKDIYMFLSHTIAYDINKFMNEPSVEWMKRKIIFSRLVGFHKTELVLADYTLTYQHILVKGGFNLFPKWANKEQTAIYYSALDTTKPTLKFLDITTGKRKRLLSSDGMLICSDVSTDSSNLLLTMAPNGQPDIYRYNIKTGKYKRITTYGGIDVNAQFMDNENKIVFISDRLGYPNVFSFDLKSKDVEQLVYYGQSNAACSSKGEYIVYKARESSNAFGKNTFNLHLISTKTDFIRRLTATGVNEFPRFSKDGDAILFIKNYKSQSSIGIVRLNYNKNYLFPMKYGKIQSIDW